MSRLKVGGLALVIKCPLGPELIGRQCTVLALFTDLQGSWAHVEFPAAVRWPVVETSIPSTTIVAWCESRQGDMRTDYLMPIDPDPDVLAMPHETRKPIPKTQPKETV